MPLNTNNITRGVQTPAYAERDLSSETPRGDENSGSNSPASTPLKSIRRSFSWGKKKKRAREKKKEAAAAAAAANAEPLNTECVAITLSREMADTQLGLEMHIVTGDVFVSYVGPDVVGVSVHSRSRLHSTLLPLITRSSTALISRPHQCPHTSTPTALPSHPTPSSTHRWATRSYQSTARRSFIPRRTTGWTQTSIISISLATCSGSRRRRCVCAPGRAPLGAVHASPSLLMRVQALRPVALSPFTPSPLPLSLTTSHPHLHTLSTANACVQVELTIEKNSLRTEVLKRHAALRGTSLDKLGLVLVRLIDAANPRYTI